MTTVAELPDTADTVLYCAEWCSPSAVEIKRVCVKFTFITLLFELMSELMFELVFELVFDFICDQFSTC